MKAINNKKWETNLKDALVIAVLDGPDVGRTEMLLVVVGDSATTLRMLSSSNF